MPTTGTLVDPFRNFNFLVDIENVVHARFTECTGLGSHTDVVEVRDGVDNSTVRKLPGRTSFSDITLKWGSTDSMVLWDWRQAVVEGRPLRQNGSIILFDLANSVEVARWTFVRAWPSQWKGADLSASGNAISIESLVIVHEGLRRVKV